MMRIFALFLLAFVLVACSDETKEKVSQEPKEEVLIEQNDEKTEVNDTNVPLPVGEPTSLLNTQILRLSPFRQGGGGVKNYESVL